MQIIIPMTGQGSRFKVAGYDRLKPFIKVHGQPIIEWVVKMFSADKDRILFICQKKHLDTLDYIKTTLQHITPKARIFPITRWQKKGPVNDIILASSMIDDVQPVLISYCDYYMHWNYEQFKQDVQQKKCEGAILCYTGFHPHLVLPSNVYASCKIDKNNDLIEIREKFSWGKDKTKTYHSAGLYYFKTGYLMKIYFKKIMALKKSINGEYYVSLPYNELVKDGLKVWCPSYISHFCQWGTPQDLQDYLFWVNTIKDFVE